MMPAGTYYVGDLCYVMHEEWDEVCSLFFAGRNDHGCNQGEFQLKDGRRFVSFNTRYGDGTYRDQDGNGYSVDAGLIGCIRVEDLHEGLPWAHCRVVEFRKDFECTTDGSILTFGHIRIDTDPPYVEHDDFCEEYS